MTPHFAAGLWAIVLGTFVAASALDTSTALTIVGLLAAACALGWTLAAREGTGA